MSQFVIVLFKDKKKKKIIKEYKNLKSAQVCFDLLLKESEEIIFEKIFENGRTCSYELALLEKTKIKTSPTYLTDDLGRNVKVKLDDENLQFIKVLRYKKEEKIFDLQKNKKIRVEEFLKNYMFGKEVKLLYSLNNKVILQEDDNFRLFSLKTKSESVRFLDSISSHFHKTKKSNCLFIKDCSTAQRKYLLKLLSEKGFSKKVLYRHSTTHPR